MPNGCAGRVAACVLTGNLVPFALILTIKLIANYPIFTSKKCPKILEILKTRYAKAL